MKLSTPQLNKFWRLFQEALKESLPPGADKETRDAFRRKIIADSTGHNSLTKVRPGKDYELLMAATAAMTDNWESRLYWDTTLERKYIHLVGICLVQIGQISNETHAWDYVRGTLRQANWPDDWQDLSADMLSSVFMMLDTHRRRLLERAGWLGSKYGQPLKFDDTLTYVHTSSGLGYRDDAPITKATIDPVSA